MLPSVPQISAIALGVALLLTPVAGQTQPASSPDPHAHHNHENHGKVAMRGVSILQTVAVPEGFAGHVAHEANSEYYWLVSFGPPANKTGPSTLYQVEAASGKVLKTASLPLLGGFGPPVALRGFLYQPMSFESRIYKISLGSNFGHVETTIPIPKASELAKESIEPGAGRLKFPWLEITGITVSAEGHLVLYSTDLGELLTIDAASGKLLHRVRTMRGLGGVTAVSGADDRSYVLANYDIADAAVKDKARRFQPRGQEVVPWKRTRATLFASRPDDKTVTWVLLDAATGDPLSSAEEPHSPAFASGTALVKYEPDSGGPYGRLNFLAMGQAGVVTLQWSPAPGSN